MNIDKRGEAASEYQLGRLLVVEGLVGFVDPSIRVCAIAKDRMKRVIDPHDVPNALQDIVVQYSWWALKPVPHGPRFPTE